MITKVIDGLYIGLDSEQIDPAILIQGGEQMAALVTRVVQTCGINHVFSYLRDSDLPSLPQECNAALYQYILPPHELLSWEYSKVLAKLENAAAHVHRVREDSGNTVLLLCPDGYNRAALLAGYYLITKLGWAHNTVYDIFDKGLYQGGKKILPMRSHRALLNTLAKKTGR